MATTLEDVKNNLPPEASNQGWTDVKLQAMVDADTSLNRILMTYWSSRAAATSKLVNVSESGSSRSLADIHKNALDMLRYWTTQAEKEEALEIVPPSQRPISFGRIKRV